jgi:hypothetical protein
MVTVRFWTAGSGNNGVRDEGDGALRGDVQAKSIVRPYGVPNSSFRAYRLPMEVLESSTREKTPALRSLAAVGREDGVVNGTVEGRGRDDE